MICICSTTRTLVRSVSARQSGQEHQFHAGLDAAMNEDPFQTKPSRHRQNRPHTKQKIDHILARRFPRRSRNQTVKVRTDAQNSTSPAGPNYPAPGGVLHKLLRTATLRDAWTAQLRALLPEDVAPHCEVANIQNGILILHCENAAWATKLRFHVPTLPSRLRQLADFVSVQDIRVRVAPNLTHAAGTLEAPADSKSPADFAPPKPPDASSLRDLAETLEEGSLKAALERLARHGD
jgi:hypothetical protein